MKTLVLVGKEMKFRLGQSGKQRVLQNFAFQVFANKLDAIIRQSWKQNPEEYRECLKIWKIF